MRTLMFIFTVLAFSGVTAQAAEPSTPAHANADHPAVAVARMAKIPTVDANTYLVQPPASVHWTVQPASVKVLAQAPQTAR